jgi:hypothetical protein
MGVRQIDQWVAECERCGHLTLPQSTEEEARNVARMDGWNIDSDDCLCEDCTKDDRGAGVI